MKRKKTIRNMLLITVLLVIAGAVYGYLEFNRKQKDTADLTPAISITATGIIKAFETNEKAATPTYNGKVIQVEGMVKEVVKVDRGFYTLVLGEAGSMSSVRCSIDSTHSEEAAKVQKGQSISVKGICSGFISDEMLGSDVQLDRCVIAYKK
jgi:hypothetical protein